MCLTVGLGQVFVQLLPVLLVEDVVDVGVDELLLFVLQVLGHVVRYKHDAALPVHHKQKPIQGLEACRKEGQINSSLLPTPKMTFTKPHIKSPFKNVAYM